MQTAGYSFPMADRKNLEDLAKLIRYHILTMTTRAGSGHPTSSLSATDLMTALLFGGYFHFDFEHPEYDGNDRLIFSKGHASPLYYALFLAAGVLTEKDLEGYRTFDSILEGHPTPRFKYTEAATGSLGQGLSMGVGMALAIRAQQSGIRDQEKKKETLTPDNRSLAPRVYVLLGDGEMAEGSVWEAANSAAYYKLDNLVAIVDVNRLGQSQETMFGWDTDQYRDRLIAFGWETTVIDGHDYTQILNAYEEATLQAGRGKPFAVIAKTEKGKGVSFLANKDGWHGKPLPKDQLQAALKELGDVDLSLRGKVEKPEAAVRDQGSGIREKKADPRPLTADPRPLTADPYNLGDSVATRKAYGTALARLGATYGRIVALDAEVKNSTYAEDFKKVFPDRFYEMFIAEQNMVGAAVGFARRGFIPFVSTFAAFLTRGFDQIRMAALSQANVKFAGSHAGVSIGEDGPSQMGLEDLAMFRAVAGSTVLYPSDAVSTEKLVEQMVVHRGIVYLRTSRPATPVLYGNEEEFPVGGSKIHRLPRSPKSPKKKAVIIAAGVTLHEALKAQEVLAKEEIEAIVVDCYSVKPIDAVTLRNLSKETDAFFVVEDHWYDGGLGDAVLNVFSENATVKIHKLAVKDMPRSGSAAELLSWAGIDAAAIVYAVKKSQ